MRPLFDMDLRARRRDRAARTGPELFLFERAFGDCLERITLMQRQFRRALLIGCPDLGFRSRMSASAERVDVVDPGAAFASAAGGRQLVEDDLSLPHEAYDLVLAVGTLDTVNDLPAALRGIRRAMTPDALLMGAISGGDTLPQLRAAMRAADRATNVAVPHVHPRIEAAALAPLLSSAGFLRPVVDVDRVPVSYRSLAGLVSDLRRMGATNVLSERPRTPLGRAEYAAASAAFAAAGDGDRTTETLEILHFAAWTASGATG